MSPHPHPPRVSFARFARFARAVDDDNRSKWVQVSTALDELVEDFDDESDTIGVPCSPLILIEFESATKLRGQYELTLPHCFADPMPTPEDLSNVGGRPLAKADVAVAIAILSEAKWRILPPSAYDLVAADAASGGLPSVRVRHAAVSASVIGCFGRNHRPQAQRVLGVAFAPEALLPLEPDLMRVHVVPDLPNEIQGAFYRETLHRGLVTCIGCSEPMTVSVPKTYVSVTVWHADDEPPGVPRFDGIWDGEPIVLSVDMHPEDWQSLIDGPPADAEPVVTPPPPPPPPPAAAMAAAPGAAQTALCSYRVKLGTTTLLGRRHRPKKADQNLTFDATVELELFGPPAPPKNLRVAARTGTNVVIEWDTPDFWGGCHLRRFDIELRHISREAGEIGRLERGEWVRVGEPSGSHTQCNAAENVFVCELRARAYNCGTYVPSEWCELVLYEYEEVEMDRKNEKEATAKVEEGKHAREKRRLAQESKVKGKGGAKVGAKGGGAQGGAKEKEGEGSKVQAEGGVATITDADDGRSLVMQQFIRRPTVPKDWSPFSQVVGAFFVQAGVPSGAHGTLFDLDAPQVEQLARKELTNTRAKHASAPLITVAVCGVWVMQTLAHHTGNAPDWVKFLNSVQGILNYAAIVHLEDVDDAMSAHEKQILHTLIEVYEALDSCTEGGHAILQLQYNYPKATKTALQSEFHAYLEEMLAEIVEATMQIERTATHLTRRAVSPVERVQLKMLLRAADKYRTGRGALSYKLASFEVRAALGTPPTISLVEMRATFGAAHVGKACRLRVSLIVGDEGGTAPSATTLLATIGHAAKAVWVNEHAVINAGDRVLAQPCTLRVTLLLVDLSAADAADGERVLEVGSTLCEMRQARGYMEAPLQEACGNTLTVAFYYEVGPWLA